MCPRYAKRRDLNEKAIIQALEAAGCDVLQGQDVDLYVGRAGRNVFLEVKRPNRATESRIQPIQRRLRDRWRGQYAIVTTPQEALDAVGAVVSCPPTAR
jgi:hypothetical protein